VRAGVEGRGVLHTPQHQGTNDGVRADKRCVCNHFTWSSWHSKPTFVQSQPCEAVLQVSAQHALA